MEVRHAWNRFRAPSKTEALLIGAFVVTSLVTFSVKRDSEVSYDRQVLRFRGKRTEVFTMSAKGVSYLDRRLSVELVMLTKSTQPPPISVTSTAHIRTESYFADTHVKHLPNYVPDGAPITLFSDNETTTGTLALNLLFKGKLRRYDGFVLTYSRDSEMGSMIEMWLSGTCLVASIAVLVLYNEKVYGRNVGKLHPINIMRVVSVLLVVANVPMVVLNCSYAHILLNIILAGVRSLVESLVMLSVFMASHGRPLSSRLVLFSTMIIVFYLLADGLVKRADRGGFEVGTFALVSRDLLVVGVTVFIFIYQNVVSRGVDRVFKLFSSAVVIISSVGVVMRWFMDLRLFNEIVACPVLIVMNAVVYMMLAMVPDEAPEFSEENLAWPPGSINV